MPLGGNLWFLLVIADERWTGFNQQPLIINNEKESTRRLSGYGSPLSVSMSYGSNLIVVPNGK